MHKDRQPSMSTSSRSTRGNSSSRSPQLAKGSACLNCRHRKIRCDGRRPACTQCTSSDNFKDCEYSGHRGVSKTRRIEEQIALVEGRIQELEGSRKSNSPSSQIASDTLSLPGGIQGTLLQIFLSQSQGLFFFLDIARITDSILSPNTADAPIVALRLAMLLWGIHLSPSTHIRAYEPTCLAQALTQGVSSSIPHPHGVIQHIQAEVLLAQYLFRVGRILEGKYHMTTAVSLVLSSGLHKFRAGSGENLVSVGEKLNGLWSVYILDNCWTAADGSPSNLAIEMEGTRIDAPWPLESAQYRQISQLPPIMTYTTRRFLSGELDYGTSVLAFQSKASILFAEGGRVSSRFKPNMGQEASRDFFAAFNRLSTAIEKFIQTLPPASSLLSTGVLIHSLAHAAVLALHMPIISVNPNARPRIITAVRKLVELLSSPFDFTDAIFGVIWMKACQFLVREAVASSGVGEPMNLLNAFITSMSALAPTCPFIASQLEQVQRALRT